MLHMFYNSYTRVSLMCSDVCCKCFHGFRRILQMFSLDVTKVDLVVVVPTCMRMGVKGAWVAGTGNRADANWDRASMRHSGVGHGLICIFTYSTFYIFGWTFSAYFNRFVRGGRLGAWEGWEERRCSVSVNLHAVNWSLALSLSSTGRQLESGKRPRTKTIYRCIIKP
jgi:hypothetical protein